MLGARICCRRSLRKTDTVQKRSRQTLLGRDRVVTHRHLPLLRWLIQKHGSFCRCGKATRIVLSKKPIPQTRDKAVAHVSDRERDGPHQSTDKSPSTSQGHQNPSHCCCAHKSLTVSNEYQRVEPLAKFRRDPRRGGDALQGCKPKPMLWIASQKPVDRIVAQTANTIKEDDVFHR